MSVSQLVWLLFWPAGLGQALLFGSFQLNHEGKEQGQASSIPVQKLLIIQVKCIYPRSLD